MIHNMYFIINIISLVSSYHITPTPSFRFVLNKLIAATTPSIHPPWELHPPIELPLVIGTATHAVGGSSTILVIRAFLDAITRTVIPIISTPVAIEDYLPPVISILVLVVDLNISYGGALGITIDVAAVELCFQLPDPFRLTF